MTETVFAIDPGYRRSAFVRFDGRQVLSHGIEENGQLRNDLKASDYNDILVLEEMQLFSSNYGVGKEIFDSVFWSGRFAEAWQPRPFDRMLRSKIRAHLGAQKGGDAAVRQALISRFGPYREDAIGKKANPGPLYGIHADEWSALALAVVWWDLHAANQSVQERTPAHV